MNHTPTDIAALREEGSLKITWSDDAIHSLPFAYVRRQCGCAACVHELTGERLLDPDSVPEDITVENLELVGSYAVRITWSDGHSSGLYTWPRLRELAN